MPLQYTNVHIPLAAGLDTKSDPRALQPPALTRALNVEFTESGGLQKRKPYAALATDIEGGGTLSDIRRLATYRDELIAFTDTKLYSWSPTLDAWQERGEHLAASVTERSLFGSTAEQSFCDRAELDGIAIYMWTEGSDPSDPDRLMIAALDVETGAVVYGPEPWPQDGNARPRLVAGDSVIFAFVYVTSGSELFGSTIDPADISGSLDNNSFSANISAGPYDVAVSGDTCYFASQQTTSTSYRVGTVNAAGTVASQLEARTCDGAIAIAVSPDADVMVVRVDGTDVEGDLLDSGLTATSDVDMALGTIGATDNQLTAAFKTVAEAGGEYRCFAFWTSGQTSGSSDFSMRVGWVETDGDASGTDDALVHRIGVAAHAFAYGDHVFVWGVFASDTVADNSPLVGVQHAYLLFRDDGEVIARAVQDVAGGFGLLNGHLGTVQDLGDSRYGWAGLERGLLTGDAGSTSYAARSPREVVLSMDSLDARRSAELGRTLYISGGIPMQYDGEGVAEVGFLIYPWLVTNITFGSPSGGNVEGGAYSWLPLYAWENAAQELERSTSTALSTTGPAPVPGTGTDVDMNIRALPVTLKQGDRSAPRLEMWRSLKNPATGAPLYRITDVDPAEDTGANRYIENDPTATTVAFTDDMADDDAAVLEQILLPGVELEDLPPASASIIVAGTERIFLAGIANEPHQIRYSKIRQDGRVASFHDGNKITLPAGSGDITALAILNETLIAFCESAIYALPGDGFDNLGAGQNFGPPRTISVDVGAQSQEAIGVTSDGIVFHGSKGWHLLTLGGGVQYIGGPVEDFDGDEFVAVHVLEGQHQIRCLSTARCLVYDTVAGQWSEWELEDAVGAVIWQGAYVYATASGVFSERSDYTGVDYSIDIETAWIKVADQLQNFGRWRRAVLLGERRDTSFAVRVRIGRNYATGYFDDRTKVLTGSVGAPLQFSHRPKYGRAQALRFRITDMAADAESVPDSEGMKLTGLSLNVGIKRGLPRLAAALKQ
jgi:hypothetical protein